MTQFTTLFSKNFLMWRRDYCCCSCQLVTAFIFGLIMMIIKVLSASSEVVKDLKLYLNSKTGDLSFPVPQLGSISAIGSDIDIINTYADMANQLNPKDNLSRLFFKNCLYTSTREASKRRGGYVVLITKNDWMYCNLENFFTKLNFTTKRFNRTQEIDAAIVKDRHGLEDMRNGIPNTVCLAISIS